MAPLDGIGPPISACRRSLPSLSEGVFSRAPPLCWSPAPSLCGSHATTRSTTAACRRAATNTTRGWPWQAMWCRPVWVGRQQSKTGTGWAGGLQFREPTDVPPATKLTALPLRILPFGFAANTHFYASLWTAGMLGVPAFRLALHRRRGRCLACGYDLRGSPALPGVRRRRLFAQHGVRVAHQRYSLVQASTITAFPPRAG